MTERSVPPMDLPVLTQTNEALLVSIIVNEANSDLGVRTRDILADSGETRTLAYRELAKMVEDGLIEFSIDPDEASSYQPTRYYRVVDARREVIYDLLQPRYKRLGAALAALASRNEGEHAFDRLQNRGH